MSKARLREAMDHHRAGRLGRAEGIYLLIVGQEPGNAEALNLLGTVQRQLGRTGEAIGTIKRAIGQRRSVPDYHFNLGEAYREAGQIDEAIASYTKVLDLRSGDAEAHHALGIACLRKGLVDRAVDSLARAVALRPDFPQAMNDLARALVERGDAARAVETCRKAVALRPGFAEGFFTLGWALGRTEAYEASASAYRRAVALRPGWWEALVNLSGVLAKAGAQAEAEATARQAVAAKPQVAEAWSNLGLVVEARGGHAEAIAAYEKAIALRADYAEAYNNLALVLAKVGRTAEAEARYRRALELRPQFAEALSNLGDVLLHAGRWDEAIAAQRRALAIRPDFWRAHSNLLLALHYRGGADPGAVFAEHVTWAQRHGPDGSVPAVHVVAPSAGDRIRVGYVSADFREHPVSSFFRPLLGGHDRGRVEVFCYSDVTRADGVTRWLAERTEHWRETAGLSCDGLVERVRRDGVEVLVDLAGHTAGHRLPAFAARAAPAQWTYLGYPDTTGLRQMDGRITDAWADPPGETERYHTERLLRLPGCFLCYEPPEGCPEAAAAAPPTGRGADVTFGCFNQFAKVSPDVIALWARILLARPGARLLLKSKALADDATRRAVWRAFAGHGVAEGRVEVAGPEPTAAAHLARYAGVDVALDTFPYHGTTTTCEALWMGVPVVSLVGRVHASRVAVSLLGAVGRTEWLAGTPDEYVRRALDLSDAGARSVEARRALRESMRTSPLCDGRSLAARIEDLFERFARPSATGA